MTSLLLDRDNVTDTQSHPDHLRLPHDAPVRVPRDPPLQEPPPPLTQTEPARIIPPVAKLGVIVNPFYENRILTIRLFGLTSAEATKRKLYQPIGHISVEAGMLDKGEIRKIGEVISDFNDGLTAQAGVLPDRLLQISSMKESGLTFGRRKLYEPEWDRSWEFPKSAPLTPTSASSALMNFLTKPNPGAPPVN